MSKRNYRFGGNVTSTVPASRQNIEQRTPSGVRPVASPVTPTGDVLGRSNGGELEMNKPKKMAFGGPSGRMAPGGSKPGAPVNQRVPGVMPQYGGPVPNMAPGGMNPNMAPGGMNPNMAPGAGRMPMAGGFGGSAGPGGFSMDGRANQFARGAMPQYGGRVPGMKKGGMASASSYEDMTGGAAGGIGRLEKSSIAAKTKSQKLKKGGKVKMADGGLSKADVFAMTGKYGSPSDDSDRREKAMAAYQARQDAAEKRARKAKAEPTFASQRAAQPGPDVDVYGDASRNRGKGGGRGGPASGGEAQMRSMGIYPFGSESPSVGGTTGLKTPMTYGDSERGNGPGPNPKKKRSALDKALFGLGLDNMGNEIREYGRTHDYAGRPIPTGARSGKIDKPDGSGGMTGRLKKGGKVMKMAKGGKAEAFEGSAKDMAQDKKLAKKYGMSKKAYEKSEIDAKHDKQKSMKGLKMGGMSKMAMGGYAAGGMSTAQDGMKGALRPKPSAMAMGGKVKRMFPGGRTSEPTYGDPAQERREKNSNRYAEFANLKSGSERNPNKSMSAKVADMFPSKASSVPSLATKGRNIQDRAYTVSGPSKKKSAADLSAKGAENENTRDLLSQLGRAMDPLAAREAYGRKMVGGKDIRNMEDPRNGMAKGGKASSHVKGCKCMACGGMAKKMAKGGAVGMTFGKPLPGTKVSSQKIRATTATGASMKKDGMKGQLRAKASGAKPTNMMKPLGMTKMASGGKVRGTGIAQRGTKFIGEV